MKKESEKKVPIEKVLRPMFRFVFTMARINDRILRSEVGTSISQFRMLIALSRMPDSSQKKIANFWDVTEASISRQIGNLMRDGLIIKTENPESRRSPLLNVSPKGKALLKKSLHHINHHAESTFKSITARERQSLSELLDRMFAAAKPEIEVFSKNQ